jgi:hypothetical protein
MLSLNNKGAVLLPAPFFVLRIKKDMFYSNLLPAFVMIIEQLLPHLSVADGKTETVPVCTKQPLLAITNMKI